MAVQNLDLARIYGAGENIKGLRTRNALMSAEMENQQQFNALAPRIAQGDRQATMQGLAADPARTKDIVSTIAALDENQRAVLRQQNEEMAKLLVSVEKTPPAQRPQAWQQAIAYARQRGLPVQDVPQQYDPQYARMAASRLMEMEQLLGSTKPLSGPGKVAADIQSGFLPEGTPLRGAGVTVNLPGEPKIGTVPPGYQAVQDPDTKAWRMEQIPGGPAAREEEAAQAAEEQKRAQRETQAGVVLEDIDRALNLVENANVPVTGFGSYLAAIPNTSARDLSSILDTVKANVGFDKLQAMRDASPTGGALGQVSEMENRLLQSVLGNLEQSQSKEQFQFNLKRLRETYLDIIHGPGNRPGQQDAQGGAGGPDPAQATETRTLPNGKTYLKIGDKWYEQ